MRIRANKLAATVHILAAVVVLLYLVNASAGTTNSVEGSDSKAGKSKIQTIFVKDAELTDEEVGQVVGLAKQVGLTNATEVGTFYFLPGGGKGITVKSAELRDGLNIYFDTVYINKVGWSVMMTNSNTKLNGQFWVRDIGKISTLLRDYKSIHGKKFQVSIGKDVDFAVADRVVELFMTGKLQFREANIEDNFFRNQLRRHGEVLPKLITKQSSESDFEMELDNYPTTVIKFKSEKEKVVVTGTSSYVI